MKARFFIILAMVLTAFAALGKSPKVAPSYAWTADPTLGLHEPSTIDTLLYNYYRQAIPSARSDAYVTTGNIFSPGRNMLFMERKNTYSDFFMRDALDYWIPNAQTQKWYNSRIPLTLVSYNFGGGRDNSQDRLQATFSGNAGRRWQVGAMLNYTHSKGSYDNQAAKNFTWGASASYMGDRYEMQAFFYHYNNLCMDNGGITNELYITDPAELQGGTSSINPKQIPVHLTTARARLRGTQGWLNNRYKVGYWHEEQIDDTTTRRNYIPVISFIHTLDFRESKYRFNNLREASGTASKFWDKTYFNPTSTEDLTSYWSLRNTLGVEMIEGFHKLVKFGLAAFASYEVRRYNQADYYYSPTPIAAGLDPFPYDSPIPHHKTENLVHIGAQLTKKHGSILTYDATGRLGIVGPVAGDVDVSGNIRTRIPLFKDTVGITGYASFSNLAAPYLLNHFVSNHFIWENNFGKERNVRFGGKLDIPWTDTHVDIGVENLQNHIYFGPDRLPVQHSANVQVFSASLIQNLRVGILHWNNRVTFQTSTNEAVIPLPRLTVYSNLYLRFKIARVLQVQFGIDCDYYTRYKAIGFEPATMTFYNQHSHVVGNYPFCNLYLNMKLSKARFYLMFSHFNQGLFGGKQYFSMYEYPLNPRRFQLGVSVDFAN